MSEAGDWIDRSVEQQEAMLSAQLSVRRPAGPARRGDGLCINECGDPALPGGPFCGCECREDFEVRERADRRAGRV